MQELNPAADNSQPEGFTAVMQAVIKPVRLNNVCQILARTVGVSNTLRVVDVVGGEDEYWYRNMILRGMEVKRDLELAVTSPTPRAHHHRSTPHERPALLHRIRKRTWCWKRRRRMPIGDGLQLARAIAAGTPYAISPSPW